MTARKAESWDAFWAEVQGAGTEVIRGVEVPIPTDVPLAMEMRLKDLESDSSEEAIREMVALLFGDTVLDQWIDAGMGLMEFKTVIAWGMAHATGTKVSFREAYDTVVAAEADEGKAPNRAARRAASKPRSASTGGRSKPTSSASTSSARTRSRA
ncbi:hypothetical protein Q5762_07480 [Streptomyces sp. P9(2023)]|uniref:hypothetical protein n=1 Tax=Streptomyces sp. P9(2023) TaxID=3064394 RepID=UPI0028F3FD13|nr:hypothetical protein [Streptomyces sp. P9(2023)]MDT9688198.1 hypothetical protein [Streptomyces sp. P9(2023)]